MDDRNVPGDDHQHTLVVMRHAKSAWHTGAADHARPLNERGLRDAPAAGRVLSQLGTPIDRVLCSSALRTRQTWEGAERGGAGATEVTHHDEIYESHPGEILHLVQQLDDRVGCALVVGHYPGVALLVQGLAEGSDHPGMAQLAEKYPTSAISVLRFTGSWAKLEVGGAELIDFVIPRG